MEQKILSVEPRRSFSSEFKLQTATLVLQSRGSVARITREYDINDNLLFRWLRLLPIKGCISRRLLLTNSSGIDVGLLPVKIALGRATSPRFLREVIMKINDQSSNRMHELLH